MISNRIGDRLSSDSGEYKHTIEAVSIADAGLGRDRYDSRSFEHFIHAACTLSEIEYAIVVLLEVMSRYEVVEEGAGVCYWIRAEYAG